jgi:hypothetical protein
MNFFIPDEPPNVIKSELENLISTGRKAIQKMAYADSRGRYEIEVGKPRMVYSVKVGPRGGRLPRHEYASWPKYSGGVVRQIVELPNVIEVYASPAGGWSNPSLVGLHTVHGSVEYFDEFVE